MIGNLVGYFVLLRSCLQCNVDSVFNILRDRFAMETNPVSFFLPVSFKRGSLRLVRGFLIHKIGSVLLCLGLIQITSHSYRCCMTPMSFVLPQ